MKKQLLFLAMLLLPMVASADAVEIDGIYYNLISKGKVAEVTSNPDKYTDSVAIPATITYYGTEYSVKSIGKRAFYKCSGLTNIDIPNSINAIGSEAFTYCDNLKYVNIHDIASWCNISFYDYYSNPLFCAKRLYLEDIEIRDLVIPHGVTSIKDYSFANCQRFTNVTIPNSVTSIGSYAFSGCI